ncbi:MAG: sulfotransferase family protein [Planctomycetaceae bacterium]
MDTKSKKKPSTQAGLTLWHGMTIGQMAKLAAYGPIVHWSRALRVAALPPLGLYNSVMTLIERAVYGRKIEAVEIQNPPLFVIGHWRSGTTLMHNLIAQDPQFNFPNLYECVFPNHFLVSEKINTRLTGWLLPKSRPMDNMPTRWDVPQEEDIAMAILTCLSPYMLCARPDRNDLVRGLWDLSLLSEQELATWKTAYMRFMKKVTLGDPRQLVVKSPANTLRIPILRALFPTAKFVYIYRNPLDVFHSTIHMRKAMFRENSLGIPQLTDIEDAVYWLQEYTHRTYERDKKQIPAGHLHEICFETLEQDPLGQLEQAYDRLGLKGWEKLETILTPQLPALRRYKKNEFKYSAEHANDCYDRLQALFDHHGYEHPARQTGAAAA